jgi:hypothetical protein
MMPEKGPAGRRGIAIERHAAPSRRGPAGAFEMPLNFRISGIVEEEGTGRPLANLIVRAYDEDVVFHDKVGFATTDHDGRFEIRFTEAHFRDFFETRPDLFLQIFDASGARVIHETRDSVRRNAALDEFFRITVPPSSLTPR